MARLSDDPTPLEPHLREAVERFGWVEAGSVPDLLALIGDGQNWHRWNNADAILRDARRIAPEERGGLDPSHHGAAMPARLWAMLTEAGREHPEDAFVTTVRRAIVNARRAANRVEDQRRLDEGWPFVLARMSPAPAAGLCEVGLGMAGRFLSAIPELPSPECTFPVCHCGWRLVTEREARGTGTAR